MFVTDILGLLWVFLVFSFLHLLIYAHLAMLSRELVYMTDGCEDVL